MKKIDLTDGQVFVRNVVNAGLAYISEGASYRKIAPLFGVSHVSIKYWLDNFLPEVAPELYAEVQKCVAERREKTVEDPEVRNRVAIAVTYILQENLTVNEIAQKMGESPWTIYHDLVRRLPQISTFGEEECKAVREALTNHSIANSPMLKKDSETPSDETKSLK